MFHKPCLSKFGKDSPRAKAVLQYSLDDNFIAEYDSAKQAMDLTGTNRNGICKCCNSDAKQAGGFRWKYKIV